ncbi:hypothetical protein AQUCO_07600112v1, partial [Aquilegia coerulea]
MEGLLLITSMVFSALLLSLALKVFHSLWLKPKSLEKQLKQQGIKGTSYKFLYGDLKDYARLFKEASSKPMNLTHHIVPRVMPFINETVKTYGKISLFWLGTKPTLIVVDPEMMKEVLSYKLGHIEKSPRNPQAKVLTMGLSTMEGEKWVKQRKVVSTPFHQEKLKRMAPAFLASCIELIERWKKSVSPKGSCELDVWPDIQNFTADVISRTAFGSKFDEGKRIFELQREQIILFVEAGQSVYLPGFRFLPTKKNKRRIYLDKEIKENLNDLIQRKLSAMRTGEWGADDLLGMLLQYCNQSPFQDDVSNLKNKRMTIDEVIEECKLFYLAGQETSSTLLTWSMILLAMHPSWQEKAREEVLLICGRRMPSSEDLTHFKIVTMILYEVLRLYPPAVRQSRYTVKKTKIGDITVPAGVQLLLPTLLIHHDHDIWGGRRRRIQTREIFRRNFKGVKRSSRILCIRMGTKDLSGPELCHDRGKDGVGYDSAKLFPSAFTLICPRSSHCYHSSTTTWSSNHFP